MDCLDNGKDSFGSLIVTFKEVRGSPDNYFNRSEWLVLSYIAPELLPMQIDGIQPDTLGRKVHTYQISGSAANQFHGISSVHTPGSPPLINLSSHVSTSCSGKPKRPHPFEPGRLYNPTNSDYLHSNPHLKLIPDI
jgi:hypothetical protein